MDAKIKKYSIECKKRIMEYSGKNFWSFFMKRCWNYEWFKNRDWDTITSVKGQKVNADIHKCRSEL